MPVSYPFINGHYYSPASVELVFRLPTSVLPMAPAGVKTLTYAPGLSPGEVRGLSPQIVGRTRGTQTDEASMELYMPQFEMLRQALGRIGFMEVPFDIIVTIFEPPTMGTTPIASDPLIHTILGARITKATNNNITSGNEALSVACDLHVMRVLLGPMEPAVYPFGAPPMGI